MIKPRSPIEMLVDRACGFDPYAPRDDVLLRCPKCGREKSAARDSTDPPGTSLVVLQCPECVQGDFDVPGYYDAEGNELEYVEKRLPTGDKK